MPTEPLHALTLIDGPPTRGVAAAQRLRDAIVSGALPPGTVLKDLEVAARMGVSPVPLREAMVQLVAEGLIEAAPYRWKRVAPLDYDAMVELLAVQQRIWEIGYEWGAPRLTATDLDVLETVHETYIAAVAGNDVNSSIEAAMSFHLVFMRASGNRELLRVSIDRLPLIHRFILLAAPGSVSEDGYGRHQQMLDDIRRNDLAACLVHFHEAGEQLLQVARRVRDCHERKRNG